MRESPQQRSRRCDGGGRRSLSSPPDYFATTAVTSISAPGLWFGDAAETRRLTRHCNDYAAAMRGSHPGRFGMFASLPKLDTEGALAEVEYALDDFAIDPRLVRGLDYYNQTVFEFWDSSTGAQNAVGGGGRYDTLIEELGGKPTPGVGFAAGIEQIVLGEGVIRLVFGYRRRRERCGTACDLGRYARAQAVGAGGRR